MKKTFKYSKRKKIIVTLSSIVFLSVSLYVIYRINRIPQFYYEEILYRIIEDRDSMKILSCDKVYTVDQLDKIGFIDRYKRAGQNLYNPTTILKSCSTNEILIFTDNDSIPFNSYFIPKIRNYIYK